jgi:hypothetical protein
MPVILATQEAQIRRIKVWGQHGQIVWEMLSWKNPLQKRDGGVAQGIGPEFKPQYCQKQSSFAFVSKFFLHLGSTVPCHHLSAPKSPFPTFLLLPLPVNQRRWTPRGGTRLLDPKIAQGQVPLLANLVMNELILLLAQRDPPIPTVGLPGGFASFHPRIAS